MTSENLRQKASQIKLVLFDVDGVLTDGGVILGSDGFEAKCFNIQDGMGITLAKESGLLAGIMTGRLSEAVSRRAKELSMDVLIQGAKDKVAALENLCSEQGLLKSEIFYMGDDVQDIGILTRCGLSATPQNGRQDVKDRVDFVTQARGGEGAAREAIEEILKLTNRWEKTLEAHLS